MAGYRPICLIVLLLIASFGPMVLMFTSVATNDPPSGGGVVVGDWTVTDARDYTDVDIRVEGNLTIAAGGDLTLTNVALTVTGNLTVTGSLALSHVDVMMNSSTGKEWWIRVSGGSASLTAVNGTVFDNNRTTDEPYYFVVVNDGTLHMENCEVGHLGNFSIAGGAGGLDLAGSMQRVGLLLQVDTAFIGDTVFSNSSGGVIVSEVSPIGFGLLEPKIVNSTFEDCVFGIVSGMRADPKLDNNTIKDCLTGIYVMLPMVTGFNTVVIEDTLVEDCDLGIGGFGAPITLTRTTVQNSLVTGLVSASLTVFTLQYRGTFYLYNSTVSYNTDGVELNHSSLTAFDSTLDGNIVRDLHLTNGSNAELLNTTFSEDGVVIDGPGNFLNASWYLWLGTRDVNGTPLADSSFEFEDAGGGVHDGWFTTAVDGWTALPHVLTEMRFNSTGATHLSPYNVTATSFDEMLRNMSSIVMDMTRSVMLDMYEFDDKDPLISITRPEHDSLLNARLVNITGNAYDNKGLDLIEVSIDGGTEWHDAVGTETWHIELDLGTDGVHNITARATDIFGRGALDHVNITIDTLPPDLVVLTPGNGSVTNKGQIEIIVSSSVAEVSIGGVIVTVGPDGNASRKVDLPTEGENLVHIWADDVAGNRAEMTLTILKDQNPPVITASVDTAYYDDSIVVNGSVSDAISGVSILESSLDGVDWTPVNMNDEGSGTISFSAGIVLEEGENNIYIRAVDAAGNDATEILLTEYIPPDVAAPIVNITEPIDGKDIGAFTFIVAGTVKDDRDVASVEVRVGSGNWTAAMLKPPTIDGKVPWSTNVTVQARGVNIIHVRAMDAAGNEGTASVSVNITADAAHPSLTISYPTNNEELNEGIIDVKGTATDDVKVVSVVVSVNDPTFSGGDTYDAVLEADGQWHVTVHLTAGSNMIFVRATDSSGKISEAEVTVTYLLPPDGGSGSLNDDLPWWLPWFTLAFVAGLITIVVFGLWSKNKERRAREAEEREKHLPPAEDEYEPMITGKDEGAKVEVERMVQQQEVEKAERRKKNYESGLEDDADIPPPTDRQVEDGTREFGEE